MEYTGATEDQIDIFFGWHEKVLLKAMQVHYASLSIRERMLLANSLPDGAVKLQAEGGDVRAMSPPCACAEGCPPCSDFRSSIRVRRSLTRWRRR